MKRKLAFLAFAAVLAGCSGSSGTADTGPADTGEVDGGVLDAEVADVGFPDSGVDAGPEDTGVVDTGADAGAPDTGPSLCPIAPTECSAPADCQDDLLPPSNCEPCRPFNRAICSEGICSTPAVLGSADIYNVTITVSPQISGIDSLVGFVVSDKTAGNRRLTCEDFYQDRVSLDEDCLNVLNSRSYPVQQAGDTYSVSFAGFTGEQRSLFLIYGHRGSPPRAPRLGVSCTEIDIPGPQGGGPYYYSGEPMLPLP